VVAEDEEENVVHGLLSEVLVLHLEVIYLHCSLFSLALQLEQKAPLVVANQN